MFGFFLLFFSSLNQVVCNSVREEEKTKRTFGKIVFLKNIIETLLQHYSYLLDFNAAICREIK